MTSMESFGGRRKGDFPFTDEEVVAIIENDDFDGDTYDKLFDYYCNSGEMPYGTAKARDGDPHQWIFDRLCERVGI